MLLALPPRQNDAFLSVIELAYRPLAWAVGLTRSRHGSMRMPVQMAGR